jgi:hypothetical protein
MNRAVRQALTVSPSETRGIACSPSGIVKALSLLNRIRPCHRGSSLQVVDPHHKQVVAEVSHSVGENSSRRHNPQRYTPSMPNTISASVRRGTVHLISRTAFPLSSGPPLWAWRLSLFRRNDRMVNYVRKSI